MKHEHPGESDDSRESGDSRARLERAYTREKPRLLSRLRAAGRTVEEAEDLLHDIYAETLACLPAVREIRNIGAWINSLVRRRLIDAWRHDRTRAAAGEIDLADETIGSIIAGAGLDPLDEYVRSRLVDALHDAIRALPAPQRRVIRAQVFDGLTFRELSEITGESIDTLMARKRYALNALSRALKFWIEAD